MVMTDTMQVHCRVLRCRGGHAVRPTSTLERCGFMVILQLEGSDIRDTETARCKAVKQ
jgi:hypothetical protein